MKSNETTLIIISNLIIRLKREIFSYNEVCEDGIEEIRNLIRSKIDANPASP